MSKAEERALEKYPSWKNGIGDEFNTNSAYYGFIEGYQQAEKDLELGWEDIVMIDKLLIDLGMMFPCKSTPDYYQEVLKRFNEQRNEDKH